MSIWKQLLDHVFNSNYIDNALLGLVFVSHIYIVHSLKTYEAGQNDWMVSVVYRLFVSYKVFSEVFSF